MSQAVIVTDDERAQGYCALLYVSHITVQVHTGQLDDPSIPKACFVDMPEDTMNCLQPMCDEMQHEWRVIMTNVVILTTALHS